MKLYYIKIYVAIKKPCHKITVGRVTYHAMKKGPINYDLNEQSLFPQQQKAGSLNQNVWD